MKSEKAPVIVDEAAKQAHAQDVWLTRFSQLMGRIVPDAISTSVFMLVVLFISALAIGNSLTATMDAYYRGLWMLLPFTMQMTLILVLGSVLGATPLFRRIILSMSRRPRTLMQVIVYSTLLSAFISYLNWGLALALGPLVDIHFASQAERKGIDIDFPFLLAAMGGAGSVWQFGLSASGPLMMATPGHFLEETTGIMSLSSTIWSPAAIFMEVGFTAAVIFVARLLMPRKPQPVSHFPGALKLIEPGSASKSELAQDEKGEGQGKGGINYSERLEQYSFVPLVLCAALAGWLYYHFLVKRASLDLNSLNTIFLLLCFLLHGNVRNFSQALQKAVVSCWPLLVLYHLYAGVAGLIQFTTVGESFTSLFAPISNNYTFPLLTVIASTVVAIFVPTSGGQWVIQGFITTKAAEAVGLTAQRGMLALGVGDQMGNLISPFWFVIRAEIARIDFRTFFGYGLIFAALWFVFGVVAFTFFPC